MIIINPRQILFGDKKPCSGNCGMNYCDENGCVERKRVLVPPPHEVLTQETQAVTQNVTALPVSGTPVPPSELTQLWDELGHLKRQRGKLATRTAILVSELEAQLRRDNPTLHELFIQGKYPHPDLQEHYAQLQEMIVSGSQLYDKIKHVEQHGTLPPAPALQADTTDEDALHQQIRRLDDLIYKTSRKINSTPPSGKKSSRIGEWKEKLALAEALRDDLKTKLKAKQNERRAQRTGSV